MFDFVVVRGAVERRMKNQFEPRARVEAPSPERRSRSRVRSALAHRIRAFAPASLHVKRNAGPVRDS